ncbi:glycosyltransferase family 2 protein [Candidatus Margulisiibacteriota bacterium]
MLDISIIIVNYNGKKTLAKCLDFAVNHKTKYKFEIILIDNNSQDDSIKIIKRYKNKLKFIQNIKNHGFSYANNQGIKIARGAYLFFLNNDAYLKESVIDKLTDYLKNNSKVGAVGPALLNIDNSPQYSGSILGHWQYKKRSVSFVGFLSAAALLCPKKVIDMIGCFDENFFFYNEDVDLCKMIIKNGFKLAYYPFVQVIHHQGVSTTTRKEASIIEGFRGGLYLVKKHYPKIIFEIYRGLIIFLALLLAIYFKLSSTVFKKQKSNYNAYKKIFRIAYKGELTIEK